MYDPPAYIWAITTATTAAIPAATCVVLYSGAKRAGLAAARGAARRGRGRRARRLVHRHRGDRGSRLV